MNTKSKKVISANLKEQVKKSTENYIETLLQQGRVREFVHGWLDEHLIRVVMRAAGFEGDSWSPRLTYGSPLYTAINTAAKEVVTSRAATIKLPIEITDREMELLQRQAKESYMQALTKSIRERAEQKAREDVDAVFVETIKSKLEPELPTPVPVEEEKVVKRTTV